MARDTKKSLSIGELAKRSGVPVKTLRFYSDEGLLPPAGRTTAGYRVYDEAAVVRLDLVRTLREAGLSIDRIRAVLGRELSLAEALRLQLGAVEAHVASLKQIASALRAALRSEPTEQDIRRLVAVTRLSNEERKAVIEGFYDEVAEGSQMDASWKKSMIEASAPTLPDDPTPAQIDAWVEISAILRDPAFIESMKKGVKETWTADFDLAAYKRCSDAMIVEARAALAAGRGPDSADARGIVERAFEGFAKAMNKQPDEDFRRTLRARFAAPDPQATRYWELVEILKGPLQTAEREPWPKAEWAWFVAASAHHFPAR